MAGRGLVVCSAAVDIDAVAETLPRGRVRVVRKPFTLDALLEALAESREARVAGSLLPEEPAARAQPQA